MGKLHPKVFEYLIKSYYYTGGYSYEYFLETLTILPLSKKFNLEELKEKTKEEARKEMEGITEENLEEFSSVAWSTREKQGTLYNTLFKYIKELNNEDIYRLLLVLFPDSQFEKMAWDRWNCLGEDVKDWRNNLIHYLEVCGIKYDNEKKQLISSDEESNIKNIIAKSDLIDIKFEDIFYKNLTKEINKCYKLGSYTASFILSRKLIENLVIDVLRKKFPANDTNLDIYYRSKEGRFHDLTILLKNLEEKKLEFGIDEEIINEFLRLIKPFRPQANSNAHSIIIGGDKDELDKLQVGKMAGLLIKILRNTNSS